MHREDDAADGHLTAWRNGRIQAKNKSDRSKWTAADAAVAA